MGKKGCGACFRAIFSSFASVAMLQLALVLLASLCISLEAAQVSASLKVDNISGGVGIHGFRAAKDSVSADVISSLIPVKMVGTLCSCSASPASTGGTTDYVCQCSNNDPIKRAAGPFPVTFSNGVDETTASDFFVDDSAGSVTLSQSGVAVQGNNVSLTFTASDAAGTTSPCSGVKTIDIIVDDDVAYTFETDNEPGECIFDNTTVIEVEDGNHEFKVRYADFMGNTATSAAVTVMADFTEPAITKAELMRAIGVPLGPLAPAVEAEVFAQFSVQENEIATATVDFAGINTINPQGIAEADCIKNETTGTYTCMTPFKKLYSGLGEAVSFSVTVKDTHGNEKTETFTPSIVIDDVQPLTSFMGSEFCVNTTCYVSNGANLFKIKFPASTTKTYRSSAVKFSLKNGAPPADEYRVSNCDETGLCTSINSVTCNEGDTVTMRIVPGSMDDAGNLVATASTDMTCDTTPPKLGPDSIEILSDDKLGLTITGSTITIIANVTEANPLFASVNLSVLADDRVDNASCTGTGDRKTCVWTAKITRPGYLTPTLRFTFTDIVGNTVKAERTISVLAIKSGNETPDFFAVQSKQVIPSQSLDRVAIDLASRNGISFPLYIQYTLVKTSGPESAQIVSQEIKDCVDRYPGERNYTASMLFSGHAIADPKRNYGLANRVNLLLATTGSSQDTFEINHLPDSVNVICNLSVRVRTDEEYYSLPAQIPLSFDLSFRNSKFGEPGQALVDKIKSEQEAVKKNQKVLKELDKYLSLFQDICSVRGQMANIQETGSAVRAIGGALGSLPVVGSNPSNLLQSTGGSVEDIISGIIDPSKESPIAYLMQGMCDFMACKLAFNDALNPLNVDSFIQDAATKLDNNVINDIGGQGGQAFNNTLGRLSEDLTQSDLHNSIIMSVQRLCLPAIVYNLNKYDQIRCSYIQQLKEMSVNGGDISYAEEVKSQQECMIYVGEIMEIPGFRVVKNFFSNLAETVKKLGSPAFWINIPTYLYCTAGQHTPYPEGEGWKAVACDLPHSTMQLIDHYTRIANGRTSDFVYSGYPDYCEVALTSCTGTDCNLGTGGSTIPYVGRATAVNNPPTIQDSYSNLFNSLMTRPGQKPVDPTELYTQQMLLLGDFNQRLAKANEVAAAQNKPQVPLVYLTDQGSPNPITSDADVANVLKQLSMTKGGYYLQPDPTSGQPVWMKGDTKVTGTELEKVDLSGMVYSDANLKTLDDDLAKQAEAKSTAKPDETSRSVNHNSADLLLTKDAKDAALYAKQVEIDNILLTMGKVNPAITGQNTNPKAILAQAKDATAIRANIDTDPLLSQQMKNLLLDSGEISSDSGTIQSYISDISVETIPATDGSGSTNVVKYIRHVALSPDMGYTYEETSEPLSDFMDKYNKQILEKIDAEQEPINARVKSINQQIAIQKGIDYALKVLLQIPGIQDWLTGKFWMDRSPGFQKFMISIDPNEWKSSMCNPDSGINVRGGSDAKAGSATTCTGNYCKVVLTQAMERVVYNYTDQVMNGQYVPDYYLYTVVYTMGPVSRDVTFNLILTGAGVSKQGYASPITFPANIQYTNQFSFLDKNVYTEMCIKFDEDFPPVSGGVLWTGSAAKEEYCRDIKENVFDTGNPVMDPELAAQAAAIAAGNDPTSYQYPPFQG